MLELRILTGLHRGAALPLEGDVIRLGNGADNDIVLLDPGMPEYAGVLERSGNASWQYRSCDAAESPQAASRRAGHPKAGSRTAIPASGRPSATPSRRVPADPSRTSAGSAVVAGARWFVGPVLIGCEEESAPWNTEPIQPGMGPPAPTGVKRFVSLKAAVSAALLAGMTVAAAMLAAPLGDSERPARAERAIDSEPVPTAPRKPAPVRIAQGTVYPAEAVSARLPFEVRSISAGPYGFVVTGDGRVLIPGSRWHAFTLERIEPGRAVFAGPHAEEVTW